jgi:hypothetical protein
VLQFEGGAVGRMRPSAGAFWIPGARRGDRCIWMRPKAFSALMYLFCTGAFDLKVVYIKTGSGGQYFLVCEERDSVLKGLVNYKLNHFFMPLFLKKSGLDAYHLSYKGLMPVSLTGPWKRTGMRFWGWTLSYDRVIARIRYRPSYHVFTGSNTRAQFKDFKGIRYDRSWETRLTTFQQWLIRLVSTRSER